MAGRSVAPGRSALTPHRAFAPGEAIIIRPMLEAYGHSDPGCVRKNNEDCYLIEPDLGLYVVADGMGGAQAGERASHLAAQTVLNIVRSTSHDGCEGVLELAFKAANREVLAQAASDASLEGMGTTLVALLECDNHFEVASVGDSRCYHFWDDEMNAVTVDQSWIQEVGRRLGIADDQLRSHPMRHVLTMAIGASAELRVQTYSLPKKSGALLLLSSDGLHGVVPEEIIAEALRSQRTLHDTCHYLIEAAREAGGPDNITVVLLRTPEAR